jgi:hypothetical protein
VADLQTVSLATAALAGKRYRATIGGEWKVASFIVDQMAKALKCRAADDLLLTADSHPLFGRARIDLATKTTRELRAHGHPSADVPSERRPCMATRVSLRRCRSTNQLMMYRPMHEISLLTDRERVMARLARKLAWGREAIFHGTRYANETLRSGRLIPPDWGDRAICLTRSPETAAYFALMLGKEVDQWSGAVLVLNRGSLSQRYRLEPCRYEDDEDDRDEREERIFGRTICFRRHLIGVVREADVTKVLGPPKYQYAPTEYFSWPEADRSAFNREEWESGERLVREGRDTVREKIIHEREAAH